MNPEIRNPAPELCTPDELTHIEQFNASLQAAPQIGRGMSHPHLYFVDQSDGFLPFQQTVLRIDGDHDGDSVTKAGPPTPRRKKHSVKGSGKGPSAKQMVAKRRMATTILGAMTKFQTKVSNDPT